MPIDFDIQLVVLFPGTNVKACFVSPGDTVTVHWSIAGNQEGVRVFQGIESQESEMLEIPSTVSDFPPTYQGETVDKSRTYDMVITQSTTFVISAFRGGDTESEQDSRTARFRVGIKHPVGYYGATIVGPSLQVQHFNALRDYLVRIEAALKNNCIVKAATSNLYPDLTNDQYISEYSGLTQDILNKMKNVVVCLSAVRVPDCYPSEKLDLSHGKEGVTPVDQTFIGINAIDGKLILHELYHYSRNIILEPSDNDQQHNEQEGKAWAIAGYCGNGL